MEIRPCRRSDFDQVKGLLDTEGLPSEDLYDHLEHLYLAEDNGEPVAVGGYERFGDIALFRSLVVRKACRGRGIGAWMLDTIEDKLRDVGDRELYLLTTDAASYFGRRGFCEISRQDAPEPIQGTRQFSGLCPSSAVVMRKTL